jgi:hypothetical protein
MPKLKSKQTPQASNITKSLALRARLFVRSGTKVGADTHSSKAQKRSYRKLFPPWPAHPYIHPMYEKVSGPVSDEYN